MQRRLPTLGIPGATVVRYFVSDGLSSAKEIALSAPHRPLLWHLLFFTSQQQIVLLLRKHHRKQHRNGQYPHNC